MPVPTKQGGKGRSGVATVSIVGEKVNVIFEDNNQAITVLLADAPDYIKNGRQAITLNTSNTEIYGARPVNGTHRCVFAGFAAKENEPPTIREVAARSGISSANKKYSIKAHLEFTALFDITAGKWKNYRLVYNLTYGFEKYSPPTIDGSNDEAWAITLVYGEKLAEFLSLGGMDFEIDSIPWSDNVLVFIEKLLLSRKRPLAISLNENGWVKSIGEIPVEDDDEEVEAPNLQPDPDTGEVPVEGDEEAKLNAKYAAELAKIKKAKAEEVEAAKVEAKKIVAELTGQDVEAPKTKKKQASAPTILDMLANQAKAGDTDALKMLTSLAVNNEQAKEKLEEITNS